MATVIVAIEEVYKGSDKCVVERADVKPKDDIKWDNKTPSDVVVIFPVPGTKKIKQKSIGSGKKGSLNVGNKAVKGKDYPYMIYIRDYKDPHYAFVEGESHPRMRIG